MPLTVPINQYFNPGNQQKQNQGPTPHLYAFKQPPALNTNVFTVYATRAAITSADSTKLASNCSSLKGFENSIHA